MITLLHKIWMRLFFTLVLFTTSLFIPFVELPIDSARAAEISPDYEVKLFMNSTVLNSEHELKSSVKEQFRMPSSLIKMRVEYLDSKSLELDKEHWNIRIRKKEDDSDFEVTYKKRYPLTESGMNLETAIASATQEGFDFSKYEPQVEWGYQKQTLSLSNSKKDSTSGFSGMDLPSASNSRAISINLIPGRLDKWVSNGWARNILNTAHIYGPVKAKRWTGIWSNEELYIEVWEILNPSRTDYDYVIEASFKAKKPSNAAAKHDELASLLSLKGWLLPADQLKTKMILERY